MLHSVMKLIRSALAAAQKRYLIFIRCLLLMLMALALVVALIISQGIDFSDRSQATADPNSFPRLAVVFSGQFDRIEVGLKLIEDGACSATIWMRTARQSG